MNKKVMKRIDSARKNVRPIKCPTCGRRLFDGDQYSTVSPKVENNIEDTGNHNFIKCPQCKNLISF